CGLDQALWDDLDSSSKCYALLQVAPSAEIIDGESVSVLPFDTARAHKLYESLFGPAADIIRGKQLLIVPFGPLTSLRFNVLVTEPPMRALPFKLADYRSAAWLGVLQPITVLPSVASLKALRSLPKVRRAAKVYLGVGNPLLDGQQDNATLGTYYK